MPKMITVIPGNITPPPAGRGLHGPWLQRQQGVKPLNQIISLSLTPPHPSHHTSLGSGGSYTPKGFTFTMACRALAQPRQLSHALTWLTTPQPIISIFQNHPWLQASDLSPRLPLAALSCIHRLCTVMANTPICFPNPASSLTTGTILQSPMSPLLVLAPEGDLVERGTWLRSVKACLWQQQGCPGRMAACLLRFAMEQYPRSLLAAFESPK